MTLKRLILFILSSSLLGVPFTSTWACGGFFCNANEPINQAAERIIFARDSEQNRIHMHVQIQYAGPPSAFGWILPTARGVETRISSEALFEVLDRLYSPRFQLSYNYDDQCAFFAYDDEAVPSAPPNNGGGGGVQVISREAIGPYDRAILDAESVEDLRNWLNENEYQIPESLDAKLGPYVENNFTFVVIKLLPDQGVEDLVPLEMIFEGNRPSIPIVLQESLQKLIWGSLFIF